MGFFSLLIVVPKLSSQQELFGIYSLCISLTLYLSYADLGFLSAGQKYAAEAFSENDRKKEIEIMGFTSSILLLMMLPFSAFLLILSYKPELLVSNLTVEQMMIAKKMFLTIAIALPITTLLQRITQTILSIRLKDYVSSRIELVASLVKIMSVFYFFSNDQFRILDYYYFITVVTFLTGIVLLFVVKKIENYDILYLIKSVRLSKKYYNKLKKLAMGSLFITAAWVVFYELDLVIISKLFTAADIALYSIAFTAFNFLRSLFNIIYSPFYPRFNHLIGINDFDGLDKKLSNLISYTFPLCILVSVVLYVSSNYLIHFWVGPNYRASVELLKILVLSSTVVFVSIPASYYIYAKEKIAYLNILSVFSLVIFFISIVIFTNLLELKGVALSKTITLVSLSIIYIMAIREGVDLFAIIKRWIVSLSTVTLLIIFGLPYLYENLYTKIEKNIYDLMILVSIMGLTITFGWFIILLLDKQSRQYAFSYAKNVRG